jgi:hypothetical protein
MARRQVKVGEGGRTVGPMRPAGRVEISGFSYDARTLGEFLDGDVYIIVEKVDAFSIIVRAMRPGESPLTISDDHDERGREAHAAELAHRARKRRAARRLAITMSLGAVLGLALFVWLKQMLGIEALPYVAWGAITGALYLLYLDCFLGASREIISENVMAEPHVALYALLPIPASVLGVLYGQYSGGDQGAVIGAVAAAFVLPPILCLLWYLLVTLLEAL